LSKLAAAAEQFGAVTVVAPDTHLSGCSHQVNVARPLELSELEPGRHSLDGTPADCARVGLLHLDPDADWVLSGINHGGNLNVDVYMSGTVAAVREAAWLGKPGIAFSQYFHGRESYDWTRGTAWAIRVLERLFEEPLPDGSFWNVNFPDPRETRREPELVFCGLEPGHLAMEYHREGDLLHYRSVYQERVRQPGSDVDVCFSGDIAISRVITTLGIGHHNT